MGVRDRLRQTPQGRRPHPVDAYLEADERARWIVPAQGGLHPLSLLVVGVAAIAGILLTIDLPWLQITVISTVFFAGAAVLSVSRYRLLAVTDAAVVLMRTRWYRPQRPVELLARVDRTEPFAVQGAMFGCVVIADEKLWIHRRFHAQLNEADAQLIRAPRRLRAASSTAYRAARAKKKVRNVGRRHR